jgi:D-psicose/D-tagatose/L-ribulose 3-epimerase
VRLAVSSLAWSPEDDASVAAVLRDAGVGRVEIAPTKKWPAPLEVPAHHLAAYRAWWESEGFTIVALQSLIYGQPDLTIFGDASARAATLGHLSRMCRLAGQLGASVLVFGAPKNRLIGDMPAAAVEAIAVPFFRSLGRVAADEGVVFCIEPNPTTYGADFVTTSTEGANLVRAVGHAGFGLHLDTAAMTLSGEDPAVAIPSVIDLVRHFHASEVKLAPVGAGTVTHAAFGAALITAGYAGTISVEMLPPPEGSTTASVVRAVSIATDAYLHGIACDADGR